MDAPSPAAPSRDVLGLSSAGWRVETGFAATQAPRHSRNFYAVYPGDAFGHPERGLIAIMARAHTPDGTSTRGARESTQLVTHSLAEGYFGAKRTLASRRAAGIAFTSINSWLSGQIGADTARHLAPVSVSALLFHDHRIGIAQIGACRMFRSRAGTMVPLLREHLRALPDGRFEPTRAVGLDPELAIEFAEEPAQKGDLYIILAGFESAGAEAVFAALLATAADGTATPSAFAAGLRGRLDADGEQDGSVMVLEVLAVPTADKTATQESLADLPLRPAPREGDLWDGFKIGRTLYHGRYTILKAAFDTIESREVALKIPLPSMLQDEVFTAGFMREAWIGTTVRGRGIARYIDLPPDRRRSLYLVMPLYRGETLETRLHRAPPVSLPDGIGIALKLCEAVQDLAALQIIHRDLKPDNVMLLDRNEIRLLDLGLAYLPGIDVQDAVKPGGTLRYMAPELMHGVQANARSEVFALGVTFYRMFAGGSFPFGQREAVPLARLRPDLPAWLGQIIKRALAENPAERFADPNALAAALQAGLMTGMGDPPAPKPHLSALRVWQAIAAVFAAGFFILLARALR